MVSPVSDFVFTTNLTHSRPPRRSCGPGAKRCALEASSLCSPLISGMPGAMPHTRTLGAIDTQHPGRPFRPILAIVYDRNGIQVEHFLVQHIDIQPTTHSCFAKSRASSRVRAGYVHVPLPLLLPAFDTVVLEQRRVAHQAADRPERRPFGKQFRQSVRVRGRSRPPPLSGHAQFGRQCLGVVPNDGTGPPRPSRHRPARSRRG